jgi:endonuclease/exonuclease/phosphatase family metal-dependent hydrolase
LDHKGDTARKESSKLILDRARTAAATTEPVFLLGDLNSTEEDPAYLTLTGSKYQNTKGFNDTLANLEQLNSTCASAFASKTGAPVRTQQSSIHLPTHRVIRPGQILENLKKQKQQEEEAEAEKYFVDTHYELMTRLSAKGAPGTLSGPFGYRDTFTSFGSGDEFERAPIRIDFIMALDNTTKVKVIHFAVLSNQFDDGLVISDHRPVIARLSW